jgi:nitrogen fixation/metabolism regulation signal transduction histidine kinase
MKSTPATTPKNSSFEKEVKEKYFSTFENLLMQMPVPVAIFRGKNFIVENINDLGLQMWGKTYEEVINQAFFEISPELSNVMEPIFKKIVETGQGVKIYEMKIEFVHNGKPYMGYYNFLCEPIRNMDGNMDGVISMGSEVTEQVIARKKIEESEAFSRSVLESSPDCVKVMDAQQFGFLLQQNIS